jgi:hypothetical protein
VREWRQRKRKREDAKEKANERKQKKEDERKKAKENK